LNNRPLLSLSLAKLASSTSPQKPPASYTWVDDFGPHTDSIFRGRLIRESDLHASIYSSQILKLSIKSTLRIPSARYSLQPHSSIPHFRFFSRVANFWFAHSGTSVASTSDESILMGVYRLQHGSPTGSLGQSPWSEVWRSSPGAKSFLVFWRSMKAANVPHSPYAENHSWRQ